MKQKTILFQVGGPYHPSPQQAELLAEWLPDHLQLIPVHSTEAFDRLDECDLFVAAGLNWTGMGETGDGLSWEFDEAHGYRPASDSQKSAFRSYVASGRPVLGFHGGIACYDDWPEFGRLLGCRWDWQVTNHGPVGTQTINIVDPSHPVVQGIPDSVYTLEQEEIYVNLQIAQDSSYTVICQAELAGARFPVLFVGDGGRIAGSGRWGYFGNGHSMATLECPQFKPLFINTVNWLLGTTSS